MSKLQVPTITKQTAQKMIVKANHAMQYTYPTPNQGFAVCLITKNGAMYEGASYNSDTYTLTMHSEAVALANAALHGETDIVAITGPNCHICKQLIWESAVRSGTDTLVITSVGEELCFTPISQLMPQPWPDENGNL